ncbi:hypothetical protein GLOTRDRAFT_126158 [Gloeophyllum trabeum ATCC 11539]|uniref:Uncharacterized protein n=1 Tax=Gloeophyllum trabeum (strain ATCC 11539 / FP-39264 / Madison 617) TaxID=670483 RepID=S7RY35_GLOTA|nr:uncharacterized protein GLOTRDRAFT_126158 [Gloeophyllum trabeum ATCC 11539]EPQ59865.1 hypothetical protein GLOTRDRAFT_126158 [Gloeophyllum trabeum ATCC 11539]
MHSWRDSGNVILHPVDSPTEWPPEATSISNALRAPLPDWVYYGPHPFTSGHCRSLAAELKAQRPLIRTGCSASSSCDATSTDALRLSFDLALCTTALLRSSILVEPDIPQDAISKTPVIAHFLRDLISIYLPDALSLYKAEYVLPRHPMSHSNPLCKFMPKTAVASLIVGTAAIEMPEDRSMQSCSADSQGSADDSNVSFSSSSAPRRWEPWELDVPGRMERHFPNADEDESEESSTTITQDSSINRHLLAAASPGDKVLLPFLCVCEGQGIFSLLASTLYQRLACGVKDPVIGLAYQYGSSTIQVLVAWLGECDMSDDSLPSVHVSYQDGSMDLPSSSMFDLHRPDGTLRLASFVMALQELVVRVREVLAEQSASPQPEPFAWRSDFNPFEENNGGSDDSMSTIATWVQNVAEATSGSTEMLPAPISPPSSALVHEMSSRAASRSRSSRSGKSSGPPQQLDTIDEHKDLKQTTSRPEKSDGRQADQASKASKTGSKRRSCSEFARGKQEEWGNNNFRDNHVAMWMADRSAVLSGFLGNESSDATIKYEEYTTFTWPAKWIALDKLPPVDPLVNDLRTELFNAFQAREAKAKAPYRPASDYVCKIMTSHLSLILHVCRYILQPRPASDAPTNHEVETRLDWDFIMRTLLRSDDVLPLLERTLRLSENIQVRYDFSQKYKDEFLSVLQAENRAFTDVIRAETSEDLDHLRGYTTRLNTVQSAWFAEPREYSLTRSQKEPLTGKCDSIAALRFPDFYPPGSEKLRTQHRLIIQDEESTAYDEPTLQPDEAQVRVGVAEPQTRTDRAIAEAGSIFGSSRNETLSLPAISNPRKEPLATRLPPHSKPTALRESRSLYAPLLVVEHKKAHDASKESNAGTKQCRMYAVTASKFLAHLGIYDFPTFGVVTNGALGAVTCTYTSRARDGTASPKDPEITRVVEARARLFNLAHPLGAFHFATFLCMVAHDHAAELRKRLEEVEGDFKAEFHAQARAGRSLVWSRDMQPDVLHAKAEAAAKSRPPSGASSPVPAS